MQELEVIEVDPYKVDKFPDVEFRYHYKWKDVEYKAGDFFMSRAEVDVEDDPELAEMWEELDVYLQHELDEVLEQSRQLEERQETFRLRFRNKTKDLLKKVEANPKNPAPYYTMAMAKAMELSQQAMASVLVARSQVVNYLKPAIIFMLQAKLRTNLPIFLAEMQDSQGNRAAVAHVWNVPQVPQDDGSLKFDEDRVNPDCLRDFRDQLYRIYAAQDRVEEFAALCKKHDPQEKMIKVFNENDQKQVEEVQKKLIIPGE